MRLTIHTDYALRMLIVLAVREGTVVSVGEIADSFGISRHHLIKVAQHLRSGGYVETTRGNGGGLRLAQPALRSISGSSCAIPRRICIS